MAKMKSSGAQNPVVKKQDPCDGHLSTKSDMIIVYTNIPFSMFNKSVNRDLAVIAKDSHGMYVTRKSYVDAPVLDPYRQYNRAANKVVKADSGYDIEFDGNILIHVDTSN